MKAVQQRSEVSDHPADLLLTDIAVEDLLEHSGSLVLRELLVIQVVRVQDQQALLAGAPHRLYEELRAIKAPGHFAGVAAQDAQELINLGYHSGGVGARRGKVSCGT